MGRRTSGDADGDGLPTGWADVASKHDLAMLRTELKGDMSELRAEFERGLRTQLHSIYVFNGIFLSLAVGVARLLS